MKNKKLTGLLLALLIIGTALFFAPSARAVPIAGSTDDATPIPWSIDDDGHLTIGDGSVYDFDSRGTRTSADYSWNTYSASIVSVSFSGTIRGHGNMSSMFEGCSQLQTANLSNFDASDVTHFWSVFQNCSSLTTVIFSGLDTSSLQYTDYMFSNCDSLTAIDFSGLSSASLTSMTYMFASCDNLSSVTFGSFACDNAGANYSYLFQDCVSVKELDLSGFDLSTGNLTNMFEGMTGLETLILGPKGYLDITAGFDGLPGYWGVESDSYQSIFPAAEARDYLYGGGVDTLKRGLMAAYRDNAENYYRDFVPIALCETYLIKALDDVSLLGNPDPIEPPNNMLFRAWATDNWNTGETDQFAPGDTIDLTSTDYDNGYGEVLFLCLSKYDVHWTWSGDKEHGVATVDYIDQYDIAHSITVDPTTPLGPDTATCDADGVYKHTASVTIEDVETSEMVEYVAEYDYPVAAHHSFPLTHTEPVNPTCTTDGNVEYWTCTSCGKHFSDSAAGTELATVVDPKLGHAWSAISYVWALIGEDYQCTASRTCGNDHAHDEQETDDTPDLTITPSTCTEDGLATWTAHFTNEAFSVQVKEIVLPATDHDWDAPTYTWNDDHTQCTATRVCKTDAAHMETQTVASVAAVTKAAGCTTAGETTYTATFTNPAFAKQSVTLADIPALGHDWDTTVWHSDANGHWRVCKRCQAHSDVEAHNPNLLAPTVEYTQHCTVCEYVIAPKLIIRSSVSFYDTGVTELPVIVVQKEKDDVDEWVVTLPADDPVKDGYYFEGWHCSYDGQLHPAGQTLAYTFADNKSVGFTARWTQLVGLGSMEVETETRYRLVSGTIMVAGDDTLYPGDQYVYFPRSGFYVVMQGGAG